ncbi:MAG: co-chaperone DjlA [Agarilytica sp.]
MFLGKLIGAILGFIIMTPMGLGLIGGIFGAFAGHFFDRGLQSFSPQAGPEERAAIERAFFEVVFPLLGKLAKSDGRISEEEVASAEEMIKRMGLTPEARTQAIDLFTQGADASYDSDEALERFLQVCRNYANLKQLLLVYLITLAYADGVLHSNEEEILRNVAKRLGYSSLAFNHLLGMVQAQNHFQQQQGYRQEQYQSRAQENELDVAYKALGVEKDFSDKEIKRAYRKLMSEYHPDKLAGSGAPEEMIKLATERSQEIQSAYDLVKKHRAKK